jgi:hypothetical protein
MFVFRFGSAYNTLLTDPTPSTTHKHDRNRSTTAPTSTPDIVGQIVEMGSSVSQPQKCVINNERWDGRASRSRESFEQRQRRWWEQRKERERELHLAPPQLRVPPSTRDEPPPIGTDHAVQNGYKEHKRKGRCDASARTLPTTLSRTPSGQGSVAGFWEHA